jgi:hypothetical protein
MRASTEARPTGNMCAMAESGIPVLDEALRARLRRRYGPSVGLGQAARWFRTSSRSAECGPSANETAWRHDLGRRQTRVLAVATAAPDGDQHADRGLPALGGAHHPNPAHRADNWGRAAALRIHVPERSSDVRSAGPAPSARPGAVFGRARVAATAACRRNARL